MKQIIFLLLSLCFSQTWGITEQTKSIYNDLRNIYISDCSLFADYLEDPESIDIENKDLFLVKDMLSETYLDPQDGDFNNEFGLYLITQKPLSHPFMERFLLICKGVKKLYNQSSKDWLIRDLFNLRKSGLQISDDIFVAVMKYLVYPLGSESVFTRNPRITNIGDMLYYEE